MPYFARQGRIHSGSSCGLSWRSAPRFLCRSKNALKFQQAECSGTTDFLTGLPNARSLFLHLETQIARLKRAGGKLAVLVCDLDEFKQVNDRFGHMEGNRVLQMTAKGIQSKSRDCDYVARS